MFVSQDANLTVNNDWRMEEEVLALGAELMTHPQRGRGPVVGPCKDYRLYRDARQIQGETYKDRKVEWHYSFSTRDSATDLLLNSDLLIFEHHNR